VLIDALNHSRSRSINPSSESLSIIDTPWGVLKEKRELEDITRKEIEPHGSPKLYLFIYVVETELF
jgi:hypothetical protein